MNTKATKEIAELWRELEEVIGAAYRLESDSDLKAALHDYAPNVGFSHNLTNLLTRETANEKQHRRGAPNSWRSPISNIRAAQLILCGNVADGADKDECPSALLLLSLRQTAIEGMVLGWAARHYISDEWKQRVRKLDYAKLMAA